MENSTATVEKKIDMVLFVNTDGKLGGFLTVMGKKHNIALSEEKTSEKGNRYQEVLLKGEDGVARKVGAAFPGKGTSDKSPMLNVTLDPKKIGMEETDSIKLVGFFHNGKEGKKDYISFMESRPYVKPEGQPSGR